MSEEFEELDQYIYRYLEIKTPSEIGKLTGHTATEVMRRAYQLKDEVDSIDIATKMTFLMMRLNKIAADAEKDARDADFRDKGALYSAATTAIKEALKQLDSLQKKNEGAVEELNQKRRQELLRLFDIVINRGVDELVETHGLDRMETLNVFRAKIVPAAQEVEAL